MTLSRFKISSADAQPPEDGESEKEPSHRLRNGLMLGAAALPFAGMIGNKAPVHEGRGQEFGSLEELGRSVKPGDVVLSSPHKKTFTTLGIGLGTGVPDVSHAAFVDDMGRLVSTEANEITAGPLLNQFEKDRAYTVLRPRAGGPLNPQEMARSYRRQFDAANKLEAAARAQGATPEAINALRSQFYTKTRGFIRTPLHSVMAPSIGANGAGDAAKKIFDDFTKNPNAANAHCHAGGWCSLPGAMAFPKGVDVVPGRLPGDTTPVDFLKSPHLQPVGGFGRGKNRYVDQMVRAGPTAARLTYGAIAAAGVYAADKALSALKKRSARKAPVAASPERTEPDTA